ncbi:hypothetical protein SOVF_014460 [Spinacia oleracea]|nr:hypothetical protein SOVF_014460 [Spinacia oleracea]
MDGPFSVRFLLSLFLHHRWPFRSSGNRRCLSVLAFLMSAFRSSGAHILFPTQDSNLRSLILLTKSSLLQTTNVSKEVVDFRIVHNSFQLLRLLNLWGIKTDDGALPKEIGHLIHLRYLGIRASNIRKLPSSIENLRNLLTLDYRNIDLDNDVHVKIPNVLWKLVQLRHIFLPLEYAWNTRKGLHFSGLKNLRILRGIRSNGGDWFSREIVNLSITVKRLKVVVSTQKDLEATFSCPNLISHQLRSFQCHWGDEIVLGHVNPMFAHNQHLSKLVLIGQVKVKNFSLILPSNLVILELEDSVVDYEDPMEAIGALAHLKLLRLSNAYTGTTFKCKIGSFPMLEEFHLENLHELSKWVIEEGAMQSLKKVQISGCRKLQHLPQGLEFVRTLQVLEFIGVPKAFVKEATECGWSRKLLRLPHNFYAIIEQCDSPVDFSSISKLHEQLRAGVFLNEKKQKYWVLKQNEVYHNCFMLYATFLDPGFSRRPVSDEFDLHYDEGCWEWIDVKESDGALMKMIKINYHCDDFAVSGEFLVNNLSPQVTYHVVCVIMLPESAKTARFYSASSRITYPDRRLQLKDLNMDGMPRGKWIRLPICDYDTPRISRGGKINFSLSFEEPGLLIQGVIIEPKL